MSVVEVEASYLQLCDFSILLLHLRLKTLHECGGTCSLPQTLVQTRLGRGERSRCWCENERTVHRVLALKDRRKITRYSMAFKHKCHTIELDCTAEKKDWFLENERCREASTEGVEGPGVEVREDINAESWFSYRKTITSEDKCCDVRRMTKRTDSLSCSVRLVTFLRSPSPRTFSISSWLSSNSCPRNTQLTQTWLQFHSFIFSYSNSPFPSSSG